MTSMYKLLTWTNIEVNPICTSVISYYGTTSRRVRKKQETQEDFK